MSRFLARVAQVARQTGVDDDLGQNSTTYVPVGAEFTITLAPASRFDQQIAATRGERVTHTAVLPAGTGLEPDDRLIVDGTAFDVRDLSELPGSTIARLEVSR